MIAEEPCFLPFNVMIHFSKNIATAASANQSSAAGLRLAHCPVTKRNTTATILKSPPSRRILK